MNTRACHAVVTWVCDSRYGAYDLKVEAARIANAAVLLLVGTTGVFYPSKFTRQSEKIFKLLSGTTFSEAQIRLLDLWARVVGIVVVAAAVAVLVTG